MLTYDELHAAVADTGIWDGGREKTHSFVLSPDAYQLPRVQADTLAEVGRAVNGCLLGVSRLMAIAADSSLCGRSEVYRYLNRLLGRGRMYGLSARIRPNNLPLWRRTDFVAGADGKLWIAEIDPANPRSLGYNQIGRLLCGAIQPQAAMLSGIVPFIAAELERRGVNELTFLYGHTQRFYAPEFAILARELLAYGITMHVLDEDDIEVSDGQPCIAKTGYPLPPYFVDFPPMNRNKPLIDWLVAATKARAVGFLAPPKHYLSSKALLAVLSNAIGNEAIERLLLTQIEPQDLAVVRRHLPPTYVVDGTLPAHVPWDSVLKKAISSGNHGVFFGGTGEFNAQLAAAKRTPGQFVIQQMVQPACVPFASYTPEGELQPTRGWFVRLTAYLSYKGVEDVAVTACRDMQVHGGKGAILTGAVVV